MLFVTIRLAFWGLVFAACFLAIRKSRVIHKRKWFFITIFIAIIFTILSALIPVENAFVTFKSPKSAYNYINSGDVKLIVNGETTDFVIGQNGDVDSYLIVPKSGEGWKLGMGFDTQRVRQLVSNGIAIYVYQYKHSSEYYITVLDTNGGISEISDNYNSEFTHLDKTNLALEKTFYTYYAYIGDLNDDYTITVNGNKLQLKN